MTEDVKTKQRVVRVGGKLKEIVTVSDEKGNVLQKVMRPLMLEFYFRDLVQVAVGASILAIPIAFTEEVWNLGEVLPSSNILLILLLSLTFIAIFVYHTYYRNRLEDYWVEFVKRVLSTYVLSFVVVAVLLTLIVKTPWQTDLALALKRTVLVTFPASMSATVVDTIK